MYILIPIVQLQIIKKYFLKYTVFCEILIILRKKLIGKVNVSTFTNHISLVKEITIFIIYRIMEDLKEENLSDENFQNFQNLSEENFQNNPWTVTNLEEFLYYCCPECDISRETIYQSRELFLKHAFDEHPMAKQGLGMISYKMSIITIFGHKHFKLKFQQ